MILADQHTRPTPQRSSDLSPHGNRLLALGKWAPPHYISPSRMLPQRPSAQTSLLKTGPPNVCTLRKLCYWLKPRLYVYTIPSEALQVVSMKGGAKARAVQVWYILAIRMTLTGRMVQKHRPPLEVLFLRTNSVPNQSAGKNSRG